MALANHTHDPWRDRMYLPNYKVSEAAYYAGIGSGTVTRWHAARYSGRTLSPKDRGQSLSYMQLIEVAVVAAFRKAGVTLRTVREARNFVSEKLGSKFPFAEYGFKSDGKELWISYQQVDQAADKGTLLGVSQKGQFAWEDILGRLEEFDYEDSGVAVRWHVAGRSKPIIIDPRISFGAPCVKGTPTWILKGRFEAGEEVPDIARDFDLTARLVRAALKFEGI